MISYAVKAETHQGKTHVLRIEPEREIESVRPSVRSSSREEQDMTERQRGMREGFLWALAAVAFWAYLDWANGIEGAAKYLVALLLVLLFLHEGACRFIRMIGKYALDIGFRLSHLSADRPAEIAPSHFGEVRRG